MLRDRTDAGKARAVHNRLSAILPEGWARSGNSAQRYMRNDFTPDDVWYVTAYHAQQLVGLYQDGFKLWIVTTLNGDCMAGQFKRHFDTPEAAFAYYHMTGELGLLSGTGHY